MSSKIDKDAEAYFALLQKEEPLHPQLAPYLTDAGGGWMILQHPLVYDVPYVSAALANHRYQYKLTSLREAEEAEDWTRLLYLYEKPYRLTMLEYYAPSIQPLEYWSLLADIWMGSENTHQQPLKRLHGLWNFYPMPRTGVMTDSELETLQALPEVVDIFRGHRGQRQGDLSWSLKEETATWFARRWSRRGAKLLRGRVQRDRIWAYLNGRNEEEIVVPRSAVTDVTVVKGSENLCTTCGAADDGEGWDGLCGNCADKTGGSS